MSLLEAVKRFCGYVGDPANVAAAPQSVAPGLTVKNMGDGVVALYIFDDIGPEWVGMIGADTVRKKLEEAGENTSRIDLFINSRGGSVVEAMGIYNFLKDHDAEVNVEIVGLAASSAGWVAMAGDTITIAENGFFMLHDPTNIAYGESEELRKAADVLDQMKGSIVRTYASRTGLAESEIADMMTAETWIEGNEAVEKGFADQVSENKAVNCAFDFGCFNNVPEAAKRLAGEQDGSRPLTVADLKDALADLRQEAKKFGVENKTGSKINPADDQEAADAELVDEMNRLMV